MTDKPLEIYLNPKHKIFADTYLITGNASESARKAGFAKASAGVTGNKLLKRADVAAYLASKANKLTEEAEDLQSKVLRELGTMAFANIADFITVDDDGQPQIDFSTATPEQLRAITSVKSKQREAYDKDGKHIATTKESAFTMADKYRGLEMLGRHLGMFKADEQRVVVDVADRLLRSRARLARLDNGATE